MATVLPPKLKAVAPDVQRFAARAVQLEKYRPIVTYWLEYYILQQILNRQLHTSDEECTQYAMQLMDKLEAYKSANQTNDAVVDDVAAQAYIENFALDTFRRAEEQQRTNKVTRQTADAFQASATFMDVLSVWAPLETEIQAKSRFAKFHALRIAKAIKAGEDPNASNPPVEERPPTVELPDEDGIEAELKRMENEPGTYRQPTVESAPESGMPSRPPSAIHTQPPSLPPSLPTAKLPPGTLSSPEHDVSPIEPEAETINSRAGSVGGGYFPAVPDAPANVNATAPLAQAPSAPPTVGTSNPADFYAQPPAIPSPGDLPPGSFVPSSGPAPHPVGSQSAAASAPPNIRTQTPLTHSVNAAAPRGGYHNDDDSILAAQKHAKWAISALNFEDVQTAVKELRIALNSLGAS